MNQSDFLTLPSAQIAQMLFGKLVTVFPVNGTRRWFMLEAKDQGNYVDVIIVFLQHGLIFSLQIFHILNFHGHNLFIYQFLIIQIKILQIYYLIILIIQLLHFVQMKILIK